MRSADCEVALDEVGAIKDLLSPLARMSFYKVKELFTSIGRCKGQFEVYGKERQQRITEPLEFFMPLIYPASEHKSSD